MHQPGIGLIGLLQRGIQGKSYDSGDHDDQRKNQLQQTGKDESHTGFRKAFACQGTLDNVLIASEIIQGTDPQSAQNDPDSRQIFIIRIGGIKDHVKLFRNLRYQFLHSGYSTGIFRIVVQGYVGSQQAAPDQEDHLYHVGQCHRFQPSIDGIGSGKDSQTDNTESDRYVDHFMNGQGSQIKDGGQIDKNKNQQPEECHESLDWFSITDFQKLRHRINFRLQEDRQKKYGNHNQGSGSYKIIGSDSQSDGKAGSGHADKLLCRYIGRYDGSSDCPPGQCIPCQEIFLRVFYASFTGTGTPKAYYHDQEYINDEDDTV